MSVHYEIVLDEHLKKDWEGQSNPAMMSIIYNHLTRTVETRQRTFENGRLIETVHIRAMHVAE